MKSGYSLFFGHEHIDQLVDCAANQGHKYLALTDTSTLAGVAKFVKSCRKKNIKPIVGTEIIHRQEDRLFTLVVLAKSEQGFKEISKLYYESYNTEIGYMDKENKFLITVTDISLLTSLKNCIVLTGGENSYIHYLTKNNKHNKLYDWWLELNNYHQNVFLEIVLPTVKEEKQRCRILSALANKYNLPTVVTNDVVYTNKANKHHYETKLSVQLKRKMFHNPSVNIQELSKKHRFIYSYGNREMLSPNKMQNLMYINDIPENTINTMKNFHYYFKDDYFYNNYWKIPSPPEHMSKPPFIILAQKAYQGLVEKLGKDIPKPYIDRLREEYLTIKKGGLSTYFLTVQYYIQLADSINCTTGIGRGSAAGSLISYALGITNIDPIKYGLSFGRFINAGRLPKPLVIDELQRQEILEKLNE